MTLSFLGVVIVSFGPFKTAQEYLSWATLMDYALFISTNLRIQRRLCELSSIQRCASIAFVIATLFTVAQIDYPAACNAAETLLVHEKLLNTIWPLVAKALLEKDVQLLCDPQTLSALSNFSPAPKNFNSHVKPATAEAYTTEHLSLTLSILAVSSLQQAISHVNAHSSHHTDCIVTESEASASTFCRGVDSAGTFVNASTRFADGFRYGFGTEVGISTGRIHARGPVGLEGLVIYKYMLRSKGVKGHIVGEFGSGEGKKKYRHTPIQTTALPF